VDRANFLFFSVPATCSYLFLRLFDRCYFSADVPFLCGSCRFCIFFAPLYRDLQGAFVDCTPLDCTPNGTYPEDAGAALAERLTVTSNIAFVTQ
jgi:hypothetical protein